MGIRTHINENAPVRRASNALTEKLFREERDYRNDRLVEKWSGVKEIGKGIKDMDVHTARNLAILLENQTRAMSKMSEAQLSTAFGDFKPENMLRLIRLSYPNSVRGQIFTEFNLESTRDSIKYIVPTYSDGMVSDKYAGEYSRYNDMDNPAANRFDTADYNTPMYESSESQFATEYVTVPTTNGSIDTTNVEPFKSMGYVDGHSRFVLDGQVVAIQSGSDLGFAPGWLYANLPMNDGKQTTDFEVTVEGSVFTLTDKNKLKDCSSAKFVGAYNSENDFAGQYLGEVQLIMKDYKFNPRPISLGVTWTQLTEVTLDTSFGVSAEEMLLDSASQEIKKHLDFQSIKTANVFQRASGNNTFTFDAAVGDSIDDSYRDTAQTITQALDGVVNEIYDKIMRGGISAIVGGPAATSYLKLSNLWKDTGRQAAIGAYKLGELDGIPVYKVPSKVIPNNELLTTWKNDNAEGDVCMAIGTLIPFYSTGVLQRKLFYKESGIQRLEDTKVLQPGYLGRIQITGIRGYAD